MIILPSSNLLKLEQQPWLYTDLQGRFDQKFLTPKINF